MSDGPILELRELEKSFGNKHVLRGVNASVKQGESLVIIGGSGTGKSVSIKCALVLLQQSKCTFDAHRLAGSRAPDNDQ